MKIILNKYGVLNLIVVSVLSIFLSQVSQAEYRKDSDRVTYIRIVDRCDALYAASSKRRPTPCIMQYYSQIKIDPESFVILNNHYGKNEQNVYYDGEILEGADPSTFQAFENSGDYHTAYDKNYLYYGKKYKIEVDGESLTMINQTTYRDKNAEYKISGNTIKKR